MTYDDVVRRFVEKFPEFEEAARIELAQSRHEEGQLAYVFFGNVLDPFLRTELHSIKHWKLLDRVFEFLESMATSDDERVQELLALGTLSYLWNDVRTADKAKTFMRKRTRVMSDEIESRVRKG